MIRPCGIGSSGYSNTATGRDALHNNSTGYENTATGHAALYSNNTGYDNTATGREALYSNTSGYWNTAMGMAALYSNITGSYNTATGRNALRSNTFGNENTATGHGALFGNTTGNENTATGREALFGNTTGSYNTATGLNALQGNTTGSYNTATGWEALKNNATGTYNTALGYGANVSSNNLTNATAIGNGASVNASNKVRIGDASVTVIEGQVDWTFPSDARFKYNVRDAGIPGLAFIEKLRPVTYQFDTRKFDEHLMQNMPDSIRRRRMEGQDYRESSALVQTGFLAQEVEQACKDLNFTFSGLHVPASAVDNYGLAYGSFVPLLVKGMQEQQAIIEAQAMEIQKQGAENAALKAQLETQAVLLQQITAALQSAGISIENKQR